MEIIKAWVLEIENLVLFLVKCWVFIIILIIVICFLMEKVFKFKADNKNCPTQFCLGNISNGFSATESREVSLIEICLFL